MESSISASLRNFGIEIVGYVAWGTHLCQFYESKKDLIDVLVPYFAEGLRSNEFCMWVTSSPLEASEAEEALRKAVPDLDAYLRKGQIEIVSYENWYLLGGKFDADRVLQGWVKKETDALKHGFEGLRLTGNTFWVERSLWKSFVNYEEAVNSVIGQHRMLALCTYCLKNASGNDVVDVVRNHAGTLLKQGKKWVLVENAVERKKEQNALLEREQSWQTTLSSVGDAVIATDTAGKITFMNNVAEKLTGWTLTEASKKPLKTIFHIVNEQTRSEVANPVTRVLKEGVTVGLANHTVLITKDGKEVPIDDSGAPIKRKDGEISGVVLIFRDITERKKAEKDLFNLAKFPSENPFAVLRIFRDGTVMYANAESLRLPKPISVQVGQIVRTQWRSHVTEALTSNCRLDFEESAGGRWFEFKVAPVLSEGYVNIYGSDITQRKKAEEAARKSEAASIASKYARSLLEASLDPLVTINAEGKITDVNQATEQATGISREELVGSDFSDYFTEPEKAKAGYQEVFVKGFVKDYPLAIRHTSGKVTDVLYNANLYRNEKGTIQGVFAAARDVTARKKAEAAAQTERKRFFDVLETLPTMVCLLTPDHHVVFANRSFREKFGESEGRHCYDYCFGKKEPCSFCESYKVLETGKPHQWEVTGPDGSIIEAYDFPFSDVDGSPLILEMDIDVTRRKKAEEELRAASLYSRSLLEASLDPLVTISAEGKITDVNKATEDVTGCSRTQLIGSDFSDYFTEPEKAKAGYEQVFTEGFVKDYPLAIRDKSGKTIDVVYNASVYRDPKGGIQGVFAAARDITQRVAMENELRQTMEKLRQSNSELEQFAYVASHDLQEPLRMVASYVQLLQRRYQGKLDPEADEFIGYAVDGANRMRGLIDDLLTYSRVGRLGKPFEPTNLESTLDIVVKNLQASIAENKATITRDKLPVISADGGQLVQLFQNLIGNAIKFHGKEPPCVHVSAKDKGTEYQFAVRDNGIGIDPQYYDRLFKIFQRLHTREEYPGSGIGLAVCKKIVERHGGRIWIESQAGKGSTIYFTLSKRKL